jgi:hypothetical protein
MGLEIVCKSAGLDINNLPPPPDFNVNVDPDESIIDDIFSETDGKVGVYDPDVTDSAISIFTDFIYIAITAFLI